jgi:hypothetical protein
MTWDDKFKGIDEFNFTLEEKKRNLVVIIDPHIKVERGYDVYSNAVKQGKLFKSKLRTYYHEISR